MKIDLTNWFEISAALIAMVCWFVKPTKVVGVLAIMLILTVAIEFYSKYLNQQYQSTHIKHYLYFRLALYSILYNSVTLLVNLTIIYWLLCDVINKKQYLIVALIGISFIAANFSFGQGHKTYNNFTTAFCWALLICFILYKLRTYTDEKFNRLHNFSVLLFLLTTFSYFTINLPCFIFFHTIFKEEQNFGVKIYRAINDSANYPLYFILSLFAILSTFRNSNDVTTKKNESKSQFAI